MIDTKADREMVDYRKFDRIVEEEVEREREEQEKESKVKVTRLEKPTKVTIEQNVTPESNKNTSKGKLNKSGLSSSYSKWDRWAKEHDDDESDLQGENNVEEMSEDVTGGDFDKVGHERPKGTASSSTKTKIRNLTENGSETPKFLWSQIADEVLLRVHCSKATKAKDVNVFLSKDRLLKVSIKGQVVLEGKLEYGVADEETNSLASEEERFLRSMTWEMEDIDESSRCVTIKLFKRPPHQGVRIWWRRVFTTDANLDEKDIDVEQIAGRSRQSVTAMQKAWKEAHEIFLANRAREREQERALAEAAEDT